MSQTHKFALLIRRISFCSKSLLPQSNPKGSYTKAETYRILAFRLFAHAEIEGFIEDCAEALVVALGAANNANHLPPKIKAHLVHHRKMVEHYPPLSLNYSPSNKDQQHIRGLLNNISSSITSNNGVSEKDVLKLFTPLGFPLSWFDTSWLSSMTDIAVARGEVAHRSVDDSISVQPTPADEKRRFVAPLLGLRKLAAEVDKQLMQL